MLIDTHSHLHFSSYDQDREQVHQRMREFDVKTITVGTAMTTSGSAVEYAEKHADTWASVGYHPEHLTSPFEDEDEKGVLGVPYAADELKRLAQSPRVVAIGETGLDYHRLEEGDRASREKQIKCFREQIQIAQELNKALVVHMRDAFLDTYNILRDTRNVTRETSAANDKSRITSHVSQIVIHAFSGTYEEAKKFLDLDCYLGIGGIVTFKPRKGTLAIDSLSEIVKKIPLDKILLETDAPWLAPQPVRGQRNEPTYVRFVAEHIAKILELPYEHICEMTTENARKCFRT